MHKQAIIVTKDNVSNIADTLSDYSAQDILDEIIAPLTQEKTVVLVKHVFDGGVAVVSHIVFESMFYANMKTLAPLNDKTFVDAVPV
jgi:hypothetical protein